MGTAEPMAGHQGPRRPIGIDSVLDLFDGCVRRWPDASAIVHDGRIVSYAELSELADRAAGRLRQDLGVGPGDVAMLAMEAGIAFAATLIGVLRTGAGYLPVDISYPERRLSEILGAAQVKVMVTPEASPRFPQACGADWLIAPPTGDTGPLLRPVPDAGDVAYMIFTSGSTGRPKGIIQTHGCLRNFVSWQVEDGGLGVRRRVLQAAPLSFDVSVQEIWYTLGSGGCLYVPNASAKRDPRELLRFITENRIEIVDLPQSLIDAIMTLAVNFAHTPALRHIISAGETVRVTPALRSLLTRRPELVLHNHYGPAETHMLAAHRMSAVLDNLESRPPVGSLIWNMYLYVLDEDGRPVPDGTVGEVYIGGAGVARGYTDPALTAAVFRPDPFRPGARLYRTRDRGRMREDRTLELLGRVDDLIKIRGYSVEPREVEEQLATVPGVRLAAAFGRERADGTMELHAAVAGEPPSVQELRRWLLRVLPDYMVPVRWWLVGDMPMSPNGKLDRRALPGPDAKPLALARR